MFVLGPTLMLDVPGSLNASLLALWESNAPYNTYTQTSTPRYHYDTHFMVNLAWGIPLGSLPLSYEGYLNYIPGKGLDEFGAKRATETNLDMQIMLDIGALAGSAKNTLKVGFEYQYWKNKFGNDHNGPAGPGAFAKTPMVRLEYHF